MLTMWMSPAKGETVVRSRVTRHRYSLLPPKLFGDQTLRRNKARFKTLENVPRNTGLKGTVVQQGLTRG